jgi:hypothetical protein
MGLPEIVRKGLPWRAKRYTGVRFKGVDENKPKASRPLRAGSRATDLTPELLVISSKLQRRPRTSG